MGRVSDAPLALTSDGKMLVNVTHFCGVDEPAVLLEVALKQEGQIFIGVSLEPGEVEGILGRLEDGAAEAVAYVIGARQKGKRE